MREESKKSEKYTRKKKERVKNNGKERKQQ